MQVRALARISWYVIAYASLCAPAAGVPPSGEKYRDTALFYACRPKKQPPERGKIPQLPWKICAPPTNAHPTGTFRSLRNRWPAGETASTSRKRGSPTGLPLSSLRRKLPAGVVDGVGRRQDQLTDGHHRVAVVDEVRQNRRQSLRRVERGIVEQHDAPRLHLGGHPLADGFRVVILPVEGVPIGNDLKSLWRKGLLVWWRCASDKKLTCKRGV